MNHNLFVALRAAFPSDLDATAIETADGEALHYRWHDLERGSARIANLLASMNLPAGAHIASHTDKSVEALMLYLAVLRAGFVYLPLNPAYQHDEMAYFLANAEPSVVVCAGRHFGWVCKLAFQSGAGHVLTLNEDRTGTLLQRAAHQPDGHVPAVRQADDVAAILYTSGTTGRSKGAMLTHANLLSNALTLKDAWGWRSAAEGGEVLIHALPLFHVHGLFVATHGALLNGSRMIWFARFDAAAVVSRLPGATVFMGVPTLYVRLLDDAGLSPQACRHMRLFVSGSAPLRVDTFEAFRARTGHTLLERYGMSETLMLTSNPLSSASGEPGRRAGTVGRPLPGVQLRVTDENGMPCPTGQVGGIEVTGPSVFAGYWRMPEKTAQEFTADGWFRTGDVGQVDADGYLTLVGRSKDLIITGGFNVYPAEVERVLNELPGVADSAIVGVPHPDFGEAVVAVVVPPSGQALDTTALLVQLKTRLANFKLPKHIAVVAELPRNAMGKVQKNLLRQAHQARFTG